MPQPDLLTVRRAAGAALRALRKRGTPLHLIDRVAAASSAGPPAAARAEALRPALAIEALVAAMRALFELAEPDARTLLLPALADWRDAVGCTDPLLVPSNAQGGAAEKQLLPIPVPSWCAWLADAGVLRFDGPPAIDGPRVVQAAWLLAVREAELAAVECFPLVFAGRFSSGEASPHVHLALSPPFLSAGWRGPICLRAAAHRPEGAAVRLWVGPPARPGSHAHAGASGESVATWVIAQAASEPAEPVDPDWPSGWPRWVVVRALEGREPQALWDLTALLPARGGAPARGPVPGASMRLAIDLGSTATVVVEEDSVTAGAVGAKLLVRPGHAPSGFRRLAGDAATAHRYGCAKDLLVRGGQLPTTLLAGSAQALVQLFAGTPGAQTSQALIDQLWLPQAAPPTPTPLTAGSTRDPRLLADRFKSPELLLLSDWLVDLPGAASLDRGEVSRRLLEAYGYLLGRTLAAAHATPLVSPEGGRWTARWPQLGNAEAVLTYPECAWSTSEAVPFQQIFEGVGRSLSLGLSAAWASASHQLVPDPAAARAARDHPRDLRHPIEVFVDFGGLTVQVTARMPQQPGRPLPFIAASSMSYLLGGERLIDSSAFAAADLDESGAELRETYRQAARRLRLLIASGDRASDGDLAGALRDAVLGIVFALVRRQILATLRRAAPDLTTLRGAGVRLYLLGEGWKLVALDIEDELREAESQRRIADFLERNPLVADTQMQVERMTKRRLCQGALRVHAPPALEETVEVQGVDLASPQGVAQRWFGVPATGSPRDLAPDPDDLWWREFKGLGGADHSLLRVEQWFNAPAAFETRLAGGKVALDARRSVLKQWLDVCGPSLVALRIHELLLGLRPKA